MTNLISLPSAPISLVLFTTRLLIHELKVHSLSQGVYSVSMALKPHDLSLPYLRKRQLITEKSRKGNKSIQLTCSCLHGARSIRGSPVVIGALDLTTSEGQVLHSHQFDILVQHFPLDAGVGGKGCWSSQEKKEQP